MDTPSPEKSPYELLGGEARVRELVQRFYRNMDEMPESWDIRQMHAESLQGSEDKLFKFLSGWLGGPDLYAREFGFPFLRRRHMPFAIGAEESQQWLHCMQNALNEMNISGPLRDFLDRAFAQTAQHMINKA